MIQFFLENTATIIGTLIVGVILALIVTKMIRDKYKAKESGGCSGCSGCPNSSICHPKIK